MRSLSLSMCVCVIDTLVNALGNRINRKINKIKPKETAVNRFNFLLSRYFVLLTIPILVSVMCVSKPKNENFHTAPHTQ